MRGSYALFSTAIVAGLVSAHAGHDDVQEQALRRDYLQLTKNDLSHCAAQIKARGLEARNIRRREQLARDLAEKKGIVLESRASADMNRSHLSPGSYDLTTPVTEIFASNGSCTLTPEGTMGPFYVTGEYIRANVTENQVGVDLTLDVQVLDVETCKPVDGVYVEIWQSNSTGVYSGIHGLRNGNPNDTSNLNTTFLRGVQPTDNDGVALFHTIFPGHYTSRTAHVHVLVHHNATAVPNGTLFDLSASHVGQLYFDQSLITEVEATSHYLVNKQPLTTNVNDPVLKKEILISDPFINYVHLGNSVEDGILGWFAFGINYTASASYNITATTSFYASGGVEHPTS